MAFGRVGSARNRNSWGPMSAPTVGGNLRGPLFQDEELAEECTERMMSAQMRQLEPLKEDLADWLNKTLSVDFLDRHNLLGELDNGVQLSHLAQIIRNKAQYAEKTGFTKAPVPSMIAKCFEKAKRGSFFARDNVANFIKFCRFLGVHDNLLFESDDLVSHNHPRNVILCLLEVSRLATRFGMEPPDLVQLEKEIAEEERRSDPVLNSVLSWQFQTSSPPPEPRLHHQNMMRHSKSAHSMSLEKWTAVPNEKIPSGASDGVPSDNTEDEWSRGSGEDPDLEIDDHPVVITSRGPAGDVPTTELDKKVQLAARQMQKNCKCPNGGCSRLKVWKVGEGKYNIAGKNVFVRLLKDRHMMVRVGGGWDTLDHFLLRHDPCQVKVVSSPDRPASASKFLHIRAKYRSPPPRDAKATR